LSIEEFNNITMGISFRDPELHSVNIRKFDIESSHAGYNNILG